MDGFFNNKKKCRQITKTLNATKIQPMVIFWERLFISHMVHLVIVLNYLDTRIITTPCAGTAALNLSADAPNSISLHKSRT